jgi:glycosyl transferase, family 25
MTFERLKYPTNLSECEPIKGLATYLINLPRSTDRRRVMEARLAELALPYTLQPGVDGRLEWDRLASTVDAEQFSRRTGRAVTPGDAGCYHAHLETWRAFLQTDAAVALILEDDVVLHPSFKVALAEALRVRSAWDYLQLNKVRAKQPVRQAYVGQWQLNAYLGPATGTGAYLITRELAQRLLPTLLPMRLPIDQELDLVHTHRFRHLGLEPFPSHVDDGGESTITGTNFSGLKKRVWYRRLPSYVARMGNLVRKAAYLARTGAIWPGSARL